MATRVSGSVGDPGKLYDSVTEKLFSLPDPTLVYPGHDYHGMTVSTIAEEKRFNPRFVGRERDRFIDLMNNLNLPNPQRLKEAIPANEHCGNLSVIPLTQSEIDNDLNLTNVRC